jgi:hypothetical protein
MPSFKKCRLDNIDKLGKCKLLKIEPCNADCLSCNKRRENYLYDYGETIYLRSGNCVSIAGGIAVTITSGTYIELNHHFASTTNANYMASVEAAVHDTQLEQRILH